MIALISVVSIIGAGVGYPLAALLAELGGYGPPTASAWSSPPPPS
ncbi:hypothetical protein O1M63_05945 [Streptomyces mirabilis]|nr:hypothetical protein [Streptomyces mirabilis]